MQTQINKKIAVLILGAIFFIFDRILKYLALELGDQGMIGLIGSFLSFKFSKNYYIAFSLPFLRGPLLSAVTFIVIIILIVILARSYNLPKKFTALLLIILGAVSNLIDRLAYGFVVDYLDLKFFTVFNIADMLIVFGSLILIADLFLENKTKAAQL